MSDEQRDAGRQPRDNEPNIDPFELVPIYSLYDEGVAEVLRIALQEEGIPCSIENARQGGFTGTLQVRLFVRSEDADRAVRILRKLGHETARD